MVIPAYNSGDFASSDGWLLHALTLAGGTTGTSLERVVMFADGIEHAVFGDEELSNCLGRLISAGIAVRYGQAFGVSSDVAARLERGSLSRQREKADRLVRKFQTEKHAVADEAPSVTECRKAIDAYHARAEEIIRGLI